MSYRYIAFDVDGTLLDTLPVSLQTLRQTLLEFTGRDFPIQRLHSTMGRSNEDALALLDLDYSQALIDRWLELQRAAGNVQMFPGIPETLAQLKHRGCILGIVTSRNRKEYEMDRRLLDQIEGMMDHVVLYEMTREHKPSPQPLQKFMELSGAAPEETLYVGDAAWDMRCAAAAGAKGALALWGALDGTVPADLYLAAPEGLLGGNEADA